MSKLTDFFRRFKPAYTLYNLLHPAQLRGIRGQYRRLGLRKTYFEPVTNVDFKDHEGEPPWLDQQDSKEALPKSEAFQGLGKEIQAAILDWSDKGYAIIPNFFSEEEVGSINKEIQGILDAQKADWKANHTKIMFAVRQSAALERIVNSRRIQAILGLLLGKEVSLFQSINFLEGSQQATHSDSIHMTTFPLGYLIAVWIALEDIQVGSGVLHYYPGSHKLPYILTPDFEHGGNRLFLGADAYPKYEKKVGEVLASEDFEKHEFLARKGDILIWHANLLHGGNPITVPGCSRKSMVLHYYAKEVACYHEITQRPALLP
jgi:hypothetical protein